MLATCWECPQLSACDVVQAAQAMLRDAGIFIVEATVVGRDAHAIPCLLLCGMVYRMVEELGEKLDGKAFVVTCMVSQLTSVMNVCTYSIRARALTCLDTVFSLM